MECSVRLSVILPVHNEASGIGSLVRDIVDVLTGELHTTGEIIVVDDASDDESAAVVETAAAEIRKLYPRESVDIHVVRHVDRSGQSCALMAGFSTARGDLIVSMDADGQYDPRDILRLMEKMREFDMVCGVRRMRSDGIARKICSVIANRFRNVATGDSVADAGCTFRIMRKQCLEALLPFDGKLSGCEFFFHPLMVRRNGFRVGEIEVTHRLRAGGKSNYKLVRGRLLCGLRACLAVRMKI